MAEAFDDVRFGRWLRMMLVAFYNDEEAALAELLYRRQAMLKDVALAKLLRLPERQVRQLLERRLVPDCIVDKQSEGTGEKLQTFYRISPIAVPVASKRLQMLDMSLAATEEERYRCDRCKQTVDALKAMSMSFTCDCGQALSSTAEELAARAARLKRFRSQCQQLLRLTQELESAQGPQFGKAKAKAKAKGRPKETPQAEAKQKAQAISQPPKASVAARSPDPTAVQAELSSAQSSRPASLQLQERLKPQGTKVAAMVEEDPSVCVQGVPYLLSQVICDDELQDRMTDEEYQSFYDLDRALQRRKLRKRMGLPDDG